MKNLEKMYDELMTSNSKLDKLAILKKYPENKKILFYIYHPQYIYGVTPKNLKKNEDLFGSVTPGDIFNLLDDLRDKDNKINELSSVNVKLQVKDKVRDLLDSEEYKDLSQGIRRAIGKNPLGFATPNAQSVEDAIADIQDYLDDELDRMASTKIPAACTPLRAALKPLSPSK